MHDHSHDHTRRAFLGAAAAAGADLSLPQLAWAEVSKAGEDMAKLMKEFSEDPGSKDNGRVYDVSPDTPMVPPFKDLSLRLKMDEVGMVISGFGWHTALLLVAAASLLMIPLALPLNDRPAAPAPGAAAQ